MHGRVVRRPRVRVTKSLIQLLFPLEPSPYLAAHCEGGSFSSCTYIFGPGRPLTLFLAIDQGHSVPNFGMPHLSLTFANRSISTRTDFIEAHHQSIFRDTHHRLQCSAETGKCDRGLQGSPIRRAPALDGQFSGKKDQFSPYCRSIWQQSSASGLGRFVWGNNDGVIGCPVETGSSQVRITAQ